MSEQSIHMSVESPAASRSVSPTPSERNRVVQANPHRPAHVILMSPAVSRTGSPTPSERNRTTQAELHRMVDILVNRAGTATPMSPRSASGVLQNPEALHLTTITAIANGLLSTCRKRNREYAQDTDEYRRQIQVLEREVAYLRRDIESGIREPPDDFPERTPEGYIPNDGRYPSLVIPAGNGLYRPAKWIKRLDDGRVAMLGSAFGPTDEPHITDIHATPAPSHMRPLKPMPLWFHQLLSGPGTLFQQLRVEAGELDDWGIYTDIIRFRQHDDELGSLYARIDHLQNALDATKYARGLAQSHLEAAQAHKRLDYLEGHAGGHPLSRPRSAWKKQRSEDVAAERGLSA